MYKKFSTDVFSLGLVQILNYIVPLLTFPYLTRVLGPESFGEYSLSLAIMMYLILIISFGFDLSSTVTISSLKNNKRNLSIYLSSVLAVKIVVMLVLLFILILVDLFGFEDLNFYIYIIPACIGGVFSCQYLFQANQKLKELAIIVFFSKFLTIPLTFVFVQSPVDLKYAVLIQSTSYFIAGLVSITYLMITSQMVLTRISKISLYNVAKDGFTVFKLNIATTIYMSGIPILIGMLVGVREVGIFNIANTIKGVFSNIFSVPTRVVFPIITNNFAQGNNLELQTVIRRSAKILFSVKLLLFIILWASSSYLVYFLGGEGYEEANWVLRFLLIASLVSLANNFSGVQTVLAMGFKKEFSNTVIKATIAGLFITLPLIYAYSSVGAAISIIIIELIILILLVMLHKELGISAIFPFTKSSSKK